MLCRKAILYFLGFFFTKTPTDSINNINAFFYLYWTINAIKQIKKEDRENILRVNVSLKVLSYFHASGFNCVYQLESSRNYFP